MLLSLLVAIPTGLFLLARGYAWIGCVAAATLFLGTWAATAGESATEVMGSFEWMLLALVVVIAASVTAIPVVRQSLFTRKALVREAGQLEESTSPAIWAEPTETERWMAAGAPFRAMRSDEHRPMAFDIPEDVQVALDEVLDAANPESIARAGGLPQEVWAKAASMGLLGLGMPRGLGGRGLTVAQLSTVVTRAAGRCLELGEILAMAGPGGFADVVERFGSDEQRGELLPMFARGEVLGALSWTGVAAEFPPHARVVRHEFEGKEAIGLRLDFRFDGVELAPVAGIFAILVETYDPDGLFGQGERLGTTCVLVRAGAQGLVREGRHHAIGSTTPAGPVAARGMVVPMTDILGGPTSATVGAHVREDSVERSHGWAIPALTSGVLQSAVMASTAYAQLQLRPTAPQTELARLASAAFTVDSLRISLGHLFNRAMDPKRPAARPGRSLSGAARVACAAEIHAGLRAARTVLGRAGTFSGSHNVTARWTGVETRLATLFGESDGAEHSLAVDHSGAMLMALDGLSLADAARAGDLLTYDALWCRRASRGASLWCRSLLRSVMRWTPVLRTPLTSRVDDAGLAFATVADTVARRIHMIPEDTRPEVTRSLSRALASLLAAASASNVHKMRGGQPIEYFVFAHSMHEQLVQVEDALDQIADLAASTGASRTLPFAVGRLTRPRRRGQLQARAVAASDMLDTRDARSRVAPAAFLPGPHERGMGLLEQAAALCYAARFPLSRIERAMRAGQIAWGPLVGALDEAVSMGILSSADRENVLASEECVRGLACFDSNDTDKLDAA